MGINYLFPSAVPSRLYSPPERGAASVPVLQIGIGTIILHYSDLWEPRKDKTSPAETSTATFSVKIRALALWDSAYWRLVFNFVALSSFRNSIT